MSFSADILSLSLGNKKETPQTKKCSATENFDFKPQTGKFSQNIFDENMFYFIEKSFSTCSSMSVYVFCTRNSNNTQPLRRAFQREISKRFAKEVSSIISILHKEKLRHRAAVTCTVCKMETMIVMSFVQCFEITC